MSRLSIDYVLPELIRRLEAHSATASLDAQVLIAHITERPRTWVLAHPEVELNKDQFKELQTKASRLEKGEPLPYILGKWEFYGINFLVSPAVLIPRPETELLVDRALQWLRRNQNRRRVIDLGTGCGCIAITLATTIRDLQITATDISLPALEIARRNAELHGVSARIQFHQRDLLKPIPSEVQANQSSDSTLAPFDLVCANLPYIPSADINSLQVSNYEPHLALDGGVDGLELIRQLLAQARSHVIPGGALLLEIEERQAMPARAAAEESFPDAAVEIIVDLAGRDRLLQIQTTF